MENTAHNDQMIESRDDLEKHSYELAGSRKSPKLLRFERVRKDLVFAVVSMHSHFCAYIGLPPKHAISGMDYSSIPIDAHGGLTFGQLHLVDGGVLPSGFFWYGWDYAHLGDFRFWGNGTVKGNERNWTLGDVIDNSQITIIDFLRLKAFAEELERKLSEKTISTKE